MYYRIKYQNRPILYNTDGWLKSEYVQQGYVEEVYKEGTRTHWNAHLRLGWMNGRYYVIDHTKGVNASHTFATYKMAREFLSNRIKELNHVSR